MINYGGEKHYFWLIACVGKRAIKVQHEEAKVSCLSLQHLSDIPTFTAFLAAERRSERSANCNRELLPLKQGSPSLQIMRVDVVVVNVCLCQR